LVLINFSLCGIHLWSDQERLEFPDIIVTRDHYGRMCAAECSNKATMSTAFCTIGPRVRPPCSLVVHHQPDRAHPHRPALARRQPETKHRRRRGRRTCKRIAGAAVAAQKHAVSSHAQFGDQPTVRWQRITPMHPAHACTDGDGWRMENRADVAAVRPRDTRSVPRAAPTAGCGERETRP